MRKHRIEELVESVKIRYESDEFAIYAVNILDEQIKRQRKELRHQNENLGKAYAALEIATKERDGIREEFRAYNRDWYSLNEKCENLECDLEDEKAYRRADAVIIQALMKENESLQNQVKSLEDYKGFKENYEETIAKHVSIAEDVTAQSIYDKVQEFYDEFPSTKFEFFTKIREWLRDKYGVDE